MKCACKMMGKVDGMMKSISMRRGGESNLTVEEVIKGFGESSEENPEQDAYANTLFQEAIQIGMEINNRYHTPEELRELMGRLTEKEIDDTFRL
ncbi:MAG: hypothetical protein J6C33_05735, partial [Lachnospiraceae bacterium]|nr:hypothetical protein [Lachnospiraceae bacterium]